jgi:hypothetical protein
MTANFNVAFAMSGIVFYCMLFGTWYGVTRNTFCITFAIIIAVFMVATHIF